MAIDPGTATLAGAGLDVFGNILGGIFGDNQAKKDREQQWKMFWKNLIFQRERAIESDRRFEIGQANRRQSARRLGGAISGFRNAPVEGVLSERELVGQANRQEQLQMPMYQQLAAALSRQIPGAAGNPGVQSFLARTRAEGSRRTFADLFSENVQRRFAGEQAKQDRLAQLEAVLSGILG